MKPIAPRFKAGLFHLAWSSLIGLTAICLIYFVWYPQATAELLEVSRIAILLIFVDVIAGPALTTVVFNTTKPAKALRIDLGVIALLQASALIYGLSSIFVARPVYIVFNIDRFNVVTQTELEPESKKRAEQKGVAMPTPWKPHIIAAKMPSLPQQRNDVMFSALENGFDLPMLAEWYVPYNNERTLAAEKARPLAELKSKNKLSEKRWTSLLARLGNGERPLAYLPLLAPPNEGVAVVDSETGELIKMLALKPAW